MLPLFGEDNDGPALRGSRVLRGKTFSRATLGGGGCAGGDGLSPSRQSKEVKVIARCWYLHAYSRRWSLQRR